MGQSLNNIKRRTNYSENTYKNVITEFLSMKKPNRQLLSSLIDRIEIDKDLKKLVKIKAISKSLPLLF